MDFIGGVFYDEVSKKIIVIGDNFDNKKGIIGYIKDQVFTQIDSTGKNVIGLIADNTLFYYIGNRLYQYDLNSGERKLVFTPKTGAFYSDYYHNISYDREGNVLLFHYSYRNLIGRLNVSSVLFNLTTKQYYMEK